MVNENDKELANLGVI